MPASSSATAASSNSFGADGSTLNPLEVIVIAVVGIIFSLIIVSAFREK